MKRDVYPTMLHELLWISIELEWRCDAVLWFLFVKEP